MVGDWDVWMEVSSGAKNIRVKGVGTRWTDTRVDHGWIRVVAAKKNRNATEGSMGIHESASAIRRRR